MINVLAIDVKIVVKLNVVVMKIVKIKKKINKTFKYKKVYFESHNHEYCYEVKEDFFTKTKTETWKLKEYIKRYYSEVSKKNLYVYSEYVKVDFNDIMIEQFFKELKVYQFKQRENKLKRILK
jgi:hypothetical protein